MRSVGIIVEYNPFHNGHLYHLNKVKEMFKENIIIAVMSGNFTQRGDSSIINKFDKTKIALSYGVDIVVELPFHYATQSADMFSKGSMQILNELNVEYVVFGSESNDIDKLTDYAKNILKTNNIKDFMDNGSNYPTSLSNKIKDIFNTEINTPNDILGICYIKEIIKNKYNIKPITIKRTNNYHSTNIEEISSATSIRNGLKNNVDISNSVPEDTLKYLNNLSFIEDYFDKLKYKILSTADLSIYQTVDEGIENRIKKYILESNSLDELISKIKTKRYTYSKIKRMLTHILVGFTKEDNIRMKDTNYIRVLGFSELGQKYLNHIKKNINIPLITNYSKYKELLKLDYKASTIYNSIYSNMNELIRNEFNKPIKK